LPLFELVFWIFTKEKRLLFLAWKRKKGLQAKGKKLIFLQKACGLARASAHSDARGASFSCESAPGRGVRPVFSDGT
jgi:hypothetical protein